MLLQSSRILRREEDMISMAMRILSHRFTGIIMIIPEDLKVSVADQGHSYSKVGHTKCTLTLQLVFSI